MQLLFFPYVYINIKQLNKMNIQNTPAVEITPAPFRESLENQELDMATLLREKDEIERTLEFIKKELEVENSKELRQIFRGYKEDLVFKKEEIKDLKEKIKTLKLKVKK